MAAITPAAAVKIIGAAIDLVGKIIGKMGKRGPSAQQALIAALIASIPTLTKELIPILIDAIKKLGRKPKAYYAADADVCHVYEDCIVGEKIKPEHRHKGTGDKELCAQCRDRMLGL